MYVCMYVCTGTEYCKPCTFAKRSLYFQVIYLHLLSFQEIYSLSGFLFNVLPLNGANAKRSFLWNATLTSLR